MKPKQFKEQTIVLVGPGGMEDKNILPLPVYQDGRQNISCWQLTEEEIINIAKTGEIWISVFSGHTAPPILPLAVRPFSKSPHYMCSFYYIKEGTETGVWVYQTVDEDVPAGFKFKDATYIKSKTHEPIRQPLKTLVHNDFYFRYSLVDIFKTNKADSEWVPELLLSVKQREGIDYVYPTFDNIITLNLNDIDHE